MRDKRPVDELSIEELERILAIRKREARQQQLRRMSQAGRRQVSQPELAPASPNPAPPDGSIAAPVRALYDNGPIVMDDGTPRFEDDLIPPEVRQQQEVKARTALWQRVWNRSLMLVEIAAVIGIVFIAVQLVQALNLLQEETAAVQAEAQAQAFASLPTPTVTPEITLTRVVLPSGHTPPNSSGGAQFNFNEIPAHLRPIIQQQMAAPIEIPTPGPESPVRIQIPAINVDAPIVSGTDWEALKRGVGHQIGTGMPGRSGNVVLSAHNDIYSEIFRYLDQLSPGDEIVIHTLTQQYRYIVRETQIVSPYAVGVMDPTRNPTTTLISCYPYQVDNQRIVVFAELQQG